LTARRAFVSWHHTIVDHRQERLSQRVAPCNKEGAYRCQKVKAYGKNNLASFLEMF
jgi:hypothetical protein